jgi:hypothetical protein
MCWYWATWAETLNFAKLSGHITFTARPDDGLADQRFEHRGVDGHTSIDNHRDTVCLNIASV